MKTNTPPSSPGMEPQFNDDEIEEEIYDEDDLEYIGDLDDVLDETQSDEEAQSEAEDVVDMSKVSFDKHSAPVICGKLSPNGELAVTGGQDDIAYVWETATGNVLFECTGHEDSVIEVSFNYDGSYVATADMKGNLKVWKISTKALICEYCTDTDILWMCWHHGHNALFAGCKSGETYMWRIPNMTDMKVLFGCGSESISGTLFPDGQKLAVGYDDGHVKIWDFNKAKMLFDIKTASESAILNIDAHSNNNVIAAGLYDGNVALGKPSARGTLNTLSTNGECVECVKFGTGPVSGILVTGHGCGRINFFDIERQSIRHSIKLENDEGVSRMIWGNNGTLYVGGSWKGVIHVLDGRNGESIKKITGHVHSILDMDISKDFKLLLTSSDDMTAKIYSLE